MHQDKCGGVGEDGHLEDLSWLDNARGRPTDAFFDGRRFRALTVVDNFSRQCLAIHVDQAIKGSDVTEIVSRISTWAGCTPDRIQVDNGGP